jgi:hypothetical protein
MKNENAKPGLFVSSSYFRVIKEGRRGRDATELVEITATYTLGNKGIDPVRHSPQASISSARTSRVAA